MDQPTDAVDVASVKLVAEILLAAAHADGHFAGTEALAIHRILRDRFGLTDLPRGLEEELYAFDPALFDLPAACRKLPLDTPEERRALLALVSEVVEADAIHDFEEDSYIRRLARTIGSSEEEYADLTVDVVAVRSLAAPPPLPKKG